MAGDNNKIKGGKNGCRTCSCNRSYDNGYSSNIHFRGTLEDTVEEIKVELETDWDGEVCTKCKRDQRIAWSIKGDKWKAVISKSNFNRNRVFCLECFLALADGKGIEIKASDFLFFAWVGMNIKGDCLIDITRK